jgi:hypothetical protein
MPLIEYHGRDGMNTLVEVEPLTLADLLGVLVRGEYLPRLRTVQTSLGGNVRKYFVIAGILPG